MPRFSRKRSFRKSRRPHGRFGRKTQRTFQSRVKRVISRAAETKYYDAGNENQQLYHNTGVTGYAHVGAVYFNPWQSIVKGTDRSNRIGDTISPVGMLLKLWLSNKFDRPTVSYRVVCCIMPRVYNGALTTAGNVDPGPTMNVGANGNYSVLPWDKEKGIKVLYDKLHVVQGYDNYAAAGKETHKNVKIWIKRKRGRSIKFDSNNQILNNYFALYVIPYDSYGSLTTDNIASMALFARLYFKDL